MYTKCDALWKLVTLHLLLVLESWISIVKHLFLCLVSNALAKKRSDYSRALLAAHKAEMREREMTGVIHQLEGQLGIEKNVQDELNKKYM